MSAAPLARSRERLWIFDLDNTLHDATPHIFPYLHRAMADYISRYLAVDEDEATRLRQRYWQRYGATLLGLMRHHRVDPKHFLWHTHQFSDLGQMLVFEKHLKAVLAKLPGRKVLFSNAPRHYAEAVLGLIGLEHVFARIYAIEEVRFRPKPDLSGFRKILRTENVAPADAIMVEDSLENLLAAKRLGMKTVWISRSHRRPAGVDLVVASAGRLLRAPSL